MPSCDFDLTSVVIPKPQKLSSIESVRSIEVDQSVVFDDPARAMFFAKIMTLHSLCVSHKQKLVLKLLGENISAASRVLLSVESNLEKNKIFNSVLSEYGDKDFKDALRRVRRTFDDMDCIRNRLAHHLWGIATSSKGDTFVILIPPASLHLGHVSGIEFSHSVEKSPFSTSPGRVTEAIRKQWPSLAEIEVWAREDFVAAATAMDAYVSTIIALLDATPPLATYLAAGMADRKELLDLIADKKLLSGSAAGYFGLRFDDRLERDCRGMHQSEAGEERRDPPD